MQGSISKRPASTLRYPLSSSAVKTVDQYSAKSSKIRKPFMAKLQGKIALISGGTSGIGAETAKLFQSEGATVIVTGSSERSVAAAKAELPGIEVSVSNAADVAATKSLVDQVKAKHGRIDVLFVNAGIAKFAPIAQVDEALFDSMFNVNV